MGLSAKKGAISQQGGKKAPLTGQIRASSFGRGPCLASSKIMLSMKSIKKWFRSGPPLMLEDSRKRVMYFQTWNSLERIVLKTERALRKEMLEWHSITSFTESHYPIPSSRRWRASSGAGRSATSHSRHRVYRT